MVAERADGAGKERNAGEDNESERNEESAEASWDFLGLVVFSKINDKENAEGGGKASHDKVGLDEES